MGTYSNRQPCRGMQATDNTLSSEWSASAGMGGWSASAQHRPRLHLSQKTVER